MKQLSPKLRLLLISVAAVLLTACLVLLIWFVLRRELAPDETAAAGRKAFSTVPGGACATRGTAAFP